MLCVAFMIAHYILGLNQSWFMGAFFLCSGYVTAQSLDRSLSNANTAGRTRRSAIRSFLRGRALRLVVPAVAYTVFAEPLTRALAAGKPLTWEFFKTYLLSIRGIQGPAWFMATAFVFDSVQSAYTALDRPLVHISRYTPPLVLAALPIFKFFWARLFPLGSHIPLLHLHGAYAPQYALAYATGVWLSSNPQLISSNLLNARSKWRASPSPALSLWLAYTLLLLALPLTRAVMYDPSPLFEGGNIQSLMYGIWNDLGFAALTHGALRVAELFTDDRRFPQGENRKPRVFPKLAYGAFLVHPVILTGLAVKLRGVELGPIVKTLVVGTLSTVASFVVSAGLNRVPYIRNVV